MPVTEHQRERLDVLIELLMQVRDLLDGDPDAEAEDHEGAAVFPTSLFYRIANTGAVDSFPGDAVDADEGDGRRRGELVGAARAITSPLNASNRDPAGASWPGYVRR